MPTFLAGFCAAGGPLTKAVGILLEKLPPPGGPTIPLGISKSYLTKSLVLRNGQHFWRDFCAPGGALAKAVGILHEKQPPRWGPTIPLGISKSYLTKNLQLRDGGHFWRVFALLVVLWQIAVGILLEKQPPPWRPTIPLGISKGYLSKNLQLGDADISCGFLCSSRSSGK